MDLGSAMRRKSNNRMRAKMLLSSVFMVFYAWQVVGSTFGAGFVAGPNAGARRSQGMRPGQGRGNLRTRRRGEKDDRGENGMTIEEEWNEVNRMIDDEIATEEQERYINEMFPEDEMWIRDEEGTVLKWMFPGARNFWICFWAIIIPPVSAGFLIVGASSGLGFQLVDLTPLTAEYLYFLKSNVFIQWVPQGIFMSFYGFGGLFLLSPLMWWLVLTNDGNGVLRFDKKTELMQIVKSGELREEVPFEEIKTVRLEWNDLALSTRELLIIKNDGEEVRWWNEGEKPKHIVERRASDLADFLDKELTLDE